MKTVIGGMSVILMMFSGVSMAYCPSGLSTQSMVDCIVVESANEAQDDFRWDEVVADFEQQTDAEKQPSPILALDNQ